MKTRNGSLQRAAESTCCATFLSWVLLLGPLGFLVFLGLAYSMVVENLALGIVCSLILFAPVLLSCAWAGLMGAEVIRSLVTERATRIPVRDSVAEQGR